MIALHRVYVYRVTCPSPSAGRHGTEDDCEHPLATDIPDAARRFCLSVSTERRGGGTISCQILINEQPFKDSVSLGAYKIADCSGAAP